MGQLDERIAELERRMKQQHKANPVSRLLVVGAMAVIRYAKPGSKSASAWLLALLERKLRKLSPLRSVCEAVIGGAD